MMQNMSMSEEKLAFVRILKIKRLNPKKDWQPLDIAEKQRYFKVLISNIRNDPLKKFDYSFSFTCGYENLIYIRAHQKRFQTISMSLSLSGRSSRRIEHL